MSMYRYMLDTNILSDLIKNPNGATARRIAAPDVEQVCCTSLIVACELRYGACKKGSSVLSARIEQLLQSMSCQCCRCKMMSPGNMRRSELRLNAWASPSEATTC